MPTPDPRSVRPSAILLYLLYSSYLLSAACLGLPAAAGAGTGTGSDIDVNKALATIEAQEPRVQALRWTVDFRQGKVEDPARPEKASFGPVRHHGQVMIEHFSGRYRVDLDSVMRWVQGINDHVAERNTWSFDGLFCRDLNYTAPGKTLPRVPPQRGDDPGRGRLYRPGQENSQFHSFRLVCGLGEMPPCHLGERLSGLIRTGLRSNRRPTINEDHGLWTISVPERDGESTIVVVYDPHKDAVLRATWQNGTPEAPWARADYELQEVDGYWFPRTIRRVNLFDKTIDQITISDVKVNMATPPGSFELDFPPWASVTDSRGKPGE